MKVSLSAFYAYVRGTTYRQTKRQADLDERVRECFYIHRRRYGTRPIAAELQTGRASVRAAMRRENLRAIAPRKFQAANDRLESRFKHQPESVEEGRQRAGCRRRGNRLRRLLISGWRTGAFVTWQFSRTSSPEGSSAGQYPRE